MTHLANITYVGYEYTLLARKLQPQNSSSAAEISRKLALHGDEKIAYMNGTYLSETNHLITEPIYLK